MVKFVNNKNDSACYNILFYFYLKFVIPVLVVPERFSSPVS